MIKRAKHDRTHKYTKISNDCLSDPRLSWKAKGLLAYILSNKSTWKIRPTELKNHAKDGINSTYTAIQELLTAGYIERKQPKNENQQFRDIEYVVREKPASSLVIVTPRKPLCGKRNAAIIEFPQEDSIVGSHGYTSKQVKIAHDLAAIENRQRIGQ